MPSRGEAGGRVADGPPGRRLGRISGTPRSGIEHLAIGISAEGDECLVAGGLKLALRREPRLLLPLGDEGPGWTAEIEQSLVEPIYQGSARRRIAFLDKGPAHASPVMRP